MTSPPSPTTSGDDHDRKAFKRDRESDPISQQPTTPSETIPAKKNRVELPRTQAFGFSSFAKGSAFGTAAAGASALSSTTLASGSKSAFDAGSTDAPSSSKSAEPFGSSLSAQSSSAATSGTSSGSKSPAQADVVRSSVGITGEEAERTIFSARGRLFEMEPASQNWKERGTGTIKCNVPNERVGGLFGATRGSSTPGTGKARSPPRLVMRTEGVLRLILNVILFPGMSVELAQEKFVRFVAFEDDKLVHFAVRMPQPKVAEELFDTIKSRIPASSNLPPAQSSTEQPAKQEKNDKADKQ
ncbi:unnamed protein product [Tilletia caries]|uniref:RanBD1 domain-containing protein n=1 Tax=Tilletia controversa TaxID=13291 RepID=A0A8X7SVV8_9BASI|nr:hypothetical protein CF328_g4283 [Tilletia controversa]KAE8246215.1 hypothetical protein A4X06_0g5110 [Tilletia controversa]CAD6889883.1 unnamed protein product [Tilletia caries]CAD6964256.1 unnamed protein product [Tilletia controversa]